MSAVSSDDVPNKVNKTRRRTPNISSDMAAPSYVGPARSRLNWWSVTPSGDYSADCQRGHQLAMQFIHHEANYPCGGTLQMIVEAMLRPLTRLEIGFLITVGSAAGAGQQWALDYDRSMRAKGYQ